MKIRTAFPDVLKRQYPVVKPDVPLLTVLYLLRMTEVEAVPITYDRGGKTRAVFGFSCLPKFMLLGPRRFRKLLEEPCENASDEIASLSADEDVETLLDTFASRRLGFALVLRGGPARNRTGLITLADVLGLYARRIISSELLVEDVATPGFSMPGSTPIRTALQAMFRYRYRRVFISERECVSERNVMQYVFSPLILEELGRSQGRDVLETPIEKLDKTKPTVVPPYTTLRTAALKLRGDRGHCLIVGRGRIATPWDVVMKPWLTGKLRIEQRARRRASLST